MPNPVCAPSTRSADMAAGQVCSTQRRRGYRSPSRAAIDSAPLERLKQERSVNQRLLGISSLAWSVRSGVMKRRDSCGAKQRGERTRKRQPRRSPLRFRVDNGFVYALRKRRLEATVGLSHRAHLFFPFGTSSSIGVDSMHMGESGDATCALALSHSPNCVPHSHLSPLAHTSNPSPTPHRHAHCCLNVANSDSPVHTLCSRHRTMRCLQLTARSIEERARDRSIANSNRVIMKGVEKWQNLMGKDKLKASCRFRILTFA